MFGIFRTNEIDKCKIAVLERDWQNDKDLYELCKKNLIEVMEKKNSINLNAKAVVDFEKLSPIMIVRHNQRNATLIWYICYDNSFSHFEICCSIDIHNDRIKEFNSNLENRNSNEVLTEVEKLE